MTEEEEMKNKNVNVQGKICICYEDEDGAKIRGLNNGKGKRDLVAKP